jgi:hypothetical protein
MKINHGSGSITYLTCREISYWQSSYGEAIDNLQKSLQSTPL